MSVTCMEGMATLIPRSPDKCNSWATMINPLNAKLNPICRLLALLRGATIVDISRLRVNPFYIQLYMPLSFACPTDTNTTETTYSTAVICAKSWNMMADNSEPPLFGNQNIGLANRIINSFWPLVQNTAQGTVLVQYPQGHLIKTACTFCLTELITWYIIDHLY
jgi:hypothetical protein